MRRESGVSSYIRDQNHSNFGLLHQGPEGVSFYLINIRLDPFCITFIGKVMACLVVRREEKESGIKIIKKLRGNMVIYIYPGTHKFSLSISHLSWGPQTLLSHHYPYFPSLTLSISNSLLSFTQPNTLHTQGLFGSLKPKKVGCK